MDYLNVTFNLTYSCYRPFIKANNEINFIHKQLNHPPSIIKQLPLSVERRLSKLSSNEKIFNDSIPIYQEALSSLQAQVNIPQTRLEKIQLITAQKTNYLV